MNYLKWLYIVFLLFIISCCKKEDNKNTLYQVKLNRFLQIATNPNFTFLKRVDYTYKAENLLVNQENDSVYRELLFKISSNFYDVYDLKSLKRTADLLFNKAVKSKDSFQIANSQRLLGNYYQDLSVNDSAYKHYLSAKKYYLKINNRLGLSEIDYNISLLQYYTNDFLGSELSLVNSLKVAKDIKSYDLIYKGYMLLGLNCFELKEYDKAVEYNIKALEIIESGKAKNQSKSQIYSHLGCVYAKMRNYNKAIEMFEIALEEENILLKYPGIFTFALDNLAYCKFKQKDYSQVLQFYITTAKIRDSLNINDGKNYNKLYLSEYYATLKDTVKANYYARESYRLSKSFNAPGDMLLALKQLISIEPKNALKYSKDYIRISDSIHQLEHVTRNKFAKIAYETEEIIKEKNTAVKQSSIFFGLAVLIFLIAVMLFIIFNLRSRQKELKFEQLQQKTNEEIYHLIQTQHEKIEEGRQHEKIRIARDLHDGVMNKLASTRFNLHLLTKNNDPEISIKCTPYIDGIHEIEKEIRNIAHNLNKEVFSENGSFKNTLLSFFEEQKEIIKAKWHIEISNKINWEILKANKKIHIFRIFQELLHNISKHAQATNVIISSNIENDQLILEVYDDGNGFSLNKKKKGIGLQNIKSRVKECDGTIKILSDKGIGTKVIITIPQTENKTV